MLAARRRRVPLAFWLIAPSLITVGVLFLAPVILTILISLTNMGSDTVLFGHRYMIAENTLQRLKDIGSDQSLIDRLQAERFVLDAETLSALGGRDLPAKAVEELRTKHAGREFANKRDLEQFLKKELRTPLRRFEDRQAIIDAARRSVMGLAFEDKEVFRAALERVGVALPDEEFEALARTVDARWQWTFQNYREMASSQFTGKILANTVFYVSLTLGLFNIGLSLVLALATFYLPTGQSAFYRALWLLPRISPSVVYIVLWKWLSADSGFLSAALGTFGIASRNWLVEFPWTFVLLINGFVGASMGMIVFSSALQAIPRTQLHAAEVDGANRWQQVVRILLPQIRWPILFVTSYQTLSLLTSFEYIQLATDGGPGFFTTEVWALQAFHTALNNYFGNLRYGYGAALAVVLVLMGIVMSLAYLRFFRFKDLVAKPPIEA